MSALSVVGELDALLGERGFAGLRDDELVGALRLVGEARRFLDALGIEASHEVSQRTVMPTGQPMSRAFGSKSAADVVAEYAGISLAEARTWSRVADATSHGLSLTGEVLPPKFAAVAEAVSSGTVSTFAADTIIRAVDEVRPFVAFDQLGGHVQPP